MKAVTCTPDELRSLREKLSPSKIEEVVGEFCISNNIEPFNNEKRRTIPPSRYSCYIVTDFVPVEKTRILYKIINEFLDLLEQDFGT